MPRARDRKYVIVSCLSDGGAEPATDSWQVQGYQPSIAKANEEAALVFYDQCPLATRAELNARGFGGPGGVSMTISAQRLNGHSVTTSYGVWLVRALVTDEFEAFLSD